MSPRGWCTRSRAPPPMKPTSPKRRRCCTAKRKTSSAMPATPGRTSGLNLRIAMYHGYIAIKRSIIKALPKALRELVEPVERALSQVRAVVEHPFHIVKNRFRYKKLRYRGLHKNTAQLHTLFALANLVIAKKVLLPPSSA